MASSILFLFIGLWIEAPVWYYIVLGFYFVTKAVSTGVEIVKKMKG